jgi:hypothetical protein
MFDGASVGLGLARYKGNRPYHGNLLAPLVEFLPSPPHQLGAQLLYDAQRDAGGSRHTPPSLHGASPFTSILFSVFCFSIFLHSFFLSCFEHILDY